MQSVLRKYIRLVDILHKINGHVLGAIIGLMTVLISWQVFARFVVGNPLTFSEEISRFVMIWMTLLGTAYGFREGSLIAIDMIPDMVRGKAKTILKITIYLISSILFYFLIVNGYEMAQAISRQKAPATGLSMFWPMMALPVGGFLMLINSVALIIEEFIGKEN